MRSTFAADVQVIVGPVLAERGFVLDEVDDLPDEGGRERHVVYYRSADCKIQVYQSIRDGEVNVMIGALAAANAFGLRAEKWQFLGRFTDRPGEVTADMISAAKAEFRSYANPLEWVRDRIVTQWDAARRGILEMYGSV
ncbi:hypothetical protein [Mycolicibacterium sediminis]|uniref:Uncharacterized protein n=1 Tax=Mycolicibacterium sediminis TaxID=1286180 RepID=A0A7I7QPC7_9MYCO|nr:hypothetical protein [Mycolicibacterium sediminis]BBY28171.1 hypothetical protein MSEDJ_22670 [Mycolicibacterium sediminis]